MVFDELYCDSKPSVVIPITWRVKIITQWHYIIIIIGASLSEPHTSETLVLSTIHKKLRIKIGELTNASIFVRVIDHATAE